MPIFDTPTIPTTIESLTERKRKRGIETKAAQREEEFGIEIQPTLDIKAEATRRALEYERNKAQNLAAGRLGYYQSAGPGTSGLFEANRLAMERAFGIQGALDKIKVSDFAAGFKLDWLGSKEQYDQNVSLQNLRFKQQQALLQQQAELNSASWWEQLGGIVGFGLGLPVGGGLSVAGYGLGQLRF